MNIKLLTGQHLEFLTLKRSCTGSSECTLVKMPHCWKSHVAAQLLFMVYFAAECPSLCPPRDGGMNIKYSLDGLLAVAEVFYSCYDDFQLTGSAVRTCTEHGNWTGEEPACEPVGMFFMCGSRGGTGGPDPPPP